MKYVLTLFVCCMALQAGATQVHRVTAQTTRMSPDTLVKRFHLKPGDLFTPALYQKAQEDLHKLRVFKTLEFVEKERKEGVDIHIKADDRSYLFPMAFALSGKKRSVGMSLASGNLFKQGESIFLFVGGGRDGFATHGALSLGNDLFYLGYTHLNFEQNFYENGWTSVPSVFSAADDKDKHLSSRIGSIHGRQDNLVFTYRHKFSSVWSFSVSPEYEYYYYKNGALDSGKHSHITLGLHYADDIRPGLNMGALSGVGLSDKAQALRNLPSVRMGKLAEVTYTTGGRWTGSQYDINKLSLGGGLLWELKTRHLIALFAKAQRAFSAPFSNRIESSDLLFGMGIYDREQRGKGGFSGGVSFTYFILRNNTGLLSIMPFYELAYITSGGNSYLPHSGVGATLTYRLWRFPLPIGVNFTQNVNDGTHHVGVKLGGRF
ncbi:MAG: hypothetical protein IKW71_01040 [Elusimicrobiaceae bacterium]|nr:hypothetical protein [Elusimicrobiaceae bacterium]